ncbi:RluA family pseudouridine synthase [Reichenbachiella versicolor]|uniref:RluA family pseudouridine synthase n=1 Tax=Reichenbachiella versicolor TaxID=1821036 RepID=UPI000D6E6DDD|nr:RluA family pseudouridine synthase [Reichenbachiella versicolor]
MSNNINSDPCFHNFKTSIAEYKLPVRFNYPHYYEPHPLCQLASKELQEYLVNEVKWNHNFSPDPSDSKADIGKMFGVLLVQTEQGKIGYLTGFSGKIAGNNQHQGFVPPILDMLKEDSFFRQGENLISEINQKVIDILESKQYKEAKSSLDNALSQSKDAINDLKTQVKKAKKIRSLRREEAKKNLDEKEFQELDQKLKKESMKAHYTLKDLNRYWKKELQSKQEVLNDLKYRIATLKKERKSRSNDLQKKLFDEYHFLNINGQSKGLIPIFTEAINDIPPSGAGDCAAPRMLQYAFEKGYKPLAMAEFWWGKPPKSSIRKHGNYYPACKSKCEPILGHMLEGMEVDENPMGEMVSNKNLLLETVFEDEYLAVVNKPAGMLSVPGKKIKQSVMSIVEKKYPNATGPLMVHRLDRATSGLLLIAKTKDTHEHLQRQFLTKTIQKRYIALLEKEIENDEGEINLPLRVDLDDRPRQLVCFEHGKPAKTKYRVINRQNGKTRVYFYPITGRTHQLRVHSAHQEGLNASIIGDELYGQISNRLHLHAEKIQFLHPKNNEEMTFKVEAKF